MSTPTGTEAAAGDRTGTGPSAVPAPREDQDDETPAPAKAGRLAPYLPARREALFLLGGLLGGAVAGSGAIAYTKRTADPEQRDDEEQLGYREALEKLEQGNARFVAGTPGYPDRTVERREDVAAGQAPFAAVLACADSRVPPETIFDQGLGDLYVVRSLGQVLDHAVLGSLQYGVEQLGTPLLVVLGHSQCGMVKATVEAVTKKTKPSGTDVDALIAAITPAVDQAEKVGAKEGNLVSVSVDLNVEQVVEALKRSPVLSDAVALRKVKIVGATYDLKSGEIDWL